MPTRGVDTDSSPNANRSEVVSYSRDGAGAGAFGGESFEVWSLFPGGLGGDFGGGRVVNGSAVFGGVFWGGEGGAGQVAQSRLIMRCRLWVRACLSGRLSL